jgi:NADPH-dependent glutamate synthase beta subunit-like oxidoreductase
LELSVTLYLMVVTHLSFISPPGYLNDDVIDARDKNVIVIGGGDTGVDCVATCVRQVRIEN